MQESLKRLVVKFLKDVTAKIEAGTCELTEEEASNIMKVLSHNVLSKEQACAYLNIKRSRFDDLVRLNIIPRGKKRRGFNELVWYEDELAEAIKRIK